MIKDYVSLVLPVRNEEQNLAILLPYLMQYCSELIVVDGHSKDRSVELARQYTSHILFDSKKGKGDAIRKSIDRISRPITVFMDADHSHNPEDIPKLFLPIIMGNFDHVSGSRMLGGSDELHGDLNKFLRTIGSDIITLGINYRFSVRLTDSQNGFRAIRTDVLRRLDLHENIATIELEMIIQTLLNRFRVGEVAAHEYARTFGVSTILMRKVAVRFVYSWLKNLFKPCINCVDGNEQLNLEWEKQRSAIVQENQAELQSMYDIYWTSLNKAKWFGPVVLKVSKCITEK